MGWIKKTDKTLKGLPKQQWIRCTKNSIKDDYVTIVDEENYVYEIVERREKIIGIYKWEKTVILNKTDYKISDQAFVKPDALYGEAVFKYNTRNGPGFSSKLPIYNLSLTLGPREIPVM